MELLAFNDFKATEESSVQTKWWFLDLIKNKHSTNIGVNNMDHQSYCANQKKNKYITAC